MSPPTSLSAVLYVPPCGVMILLVLVSIPECYSLNLSSSDELEHLSEVYPIQLRYNQQRIFPSLRFTFSGRIIGWKIPAVNGTGRGLPILSVWRPTTIASNTFSILQSELIDGCLTPNVTTNAGGPMISFHNSGPPAPGISFDNGDILGLLIRRESVSNFAPFLYDGTLQTRVSVVTGTEFSYFFTTAGERPDTSLTVGGPTLMSDSLLPLLSLELCSLETNTAGMPICDETTSQRSDEECSMTIMPETTTEATTETTTTTTTTELVSTLGLSEMLLTITIAVPSALLILLVIILTIFIIMCCLFARKRKHSTYTVDIALEDLQDVSTTNDIQNYSTSGPSSVLGQECGITTSTTTFISSCSTPNGGGGEEKSNEAGNYEAPVTIGTPNGSAGMMNGGGFPSIYPHESGSHVYDSPSISRHTSAGTPRSTTPIPPIVVQQVNLTAPPSSRPAHCKNSFLPPPPPPPPSLHPLPQWRENLVSSQEDNSGTPIYESLDQTNDTNSTTIPSTMINISVSNDLGVTSPSSPWQYKTKRHSSENLMFRRISSGRGPPPSNSNTDSAPDRFFRLEDGIYVPTKHQRNCYSISSLFDDTSYATFKTPNSPNANNWAFFEECEKYWRPAADSSALFDQLANKKYREINRKQIEIGDHLGSGEFGTVCHALWHTEQGDLDVAVKILNKYSTEKDTIRFIQEAAIMGQFKHPNIVRLHGVVTVDEPMMIILELVENGDLRKNLKSLRPVPGELIPRSLPQKLLDFCSQIALGMEYLSRREFIHRDLAARNVLLTEENICKIADFGMSRDLEDENHYESQTGKIPIKWSAPETMRYRKFSIASDVWSFGILMYEVWSLGRTPYKNKTPEQTITLVGSGCRLAPPPGCPRAIYDIMIQCWNPEPNCRPSFTNLLRALSQPTDTLLHWSPNDSNIHPQANVLGSDLSSAMELYPLMQKIYTYSSADSD